MHGILIYTSVLAPNITNLSPIPPPFITNMVYFITNMVYLTTNMAHLVINMAHLTPDVAN